MCRFRSKELFAVFLIILCCATSIDLFGHDANMPIRKVSLHKEGEKFCLQVEIDHRFPCAASYHVLPAGVMAILSFNREVTTPAAKRMRHKLIKGCFFDQIGARTLRFITAFRENIEVLDYALKKNTLKIYFKVYAKRTVVIDAGHGGHDDGATAVSGDKEKNIALMLAIELRNMLVNSGRYKVVLTRDRDVFLSLDERLHIANQAKGAIFISLHTDSNPNASWRGMSVYTLPDLKDIKHSSGIDYASLKNVEQYNLNLQRSKEYANCLVNFVPNSFTVKTRPCRSSEFKLLKADMPAILVEVGCISNKKDDALLHSGIFRDKINSAIMYGLDNFFSAEEK